MDTKKIALISNVTADFIVNKIKRNYSVYVPEGYNAWVQELINANSAVYNQTFDAIIVLVDGMETREWGDTDEVHDRIDIWKQAIEILCKRVKNVPIIISSVDFQSSCIRTYTERCFDIQYADEWYQFIQGIIETQNNVLMLDIKNLITTYGRKTIYSNKMWYLSNSPYSLEGLRIITEEIKLTLAALFEARKKIIVLDLDNTLWGGVIGEDGLQGIELSNYKEGRRFYDFQIAIKRMKEKGVLLGVNSKNNEADVMEVFESDPFMVLSYDDFVSLKINWENKALNLRDIAKELNLTEGSFVFIDDNPAEREIVKGEIPDVIVPDFPENTSELIDFADNLWKNYLKPVRLVEEDKDKTEKYKLEKKRKADLNESIDIEDYIRRLEIEVDVHPMREDEIERVSQLFGKTNQFNLTTKRYTRVQIENLSKNENVFVMSTADKYGNNGLISVLVLKDKGDDSKMIDSFLMSCRVMGRKLEDLFIKLICENVNCKTIYSEYVKTEKNAPVKNLYERLGFDCIENTEHKKQYFLEVEKYHNSIDKSVFKSIVFTGENS